MSIDWTRVTRELTVLGVLLTTAYSCFVGAIYAVFVPQLCEATIRVGNSTTVVGSDCTFAQNVYEDIDMLNAIVLAVNLLSAILLLAGFFYSFKRESWICEHLDVNEELPEDNLKDELVGYAAFKNALQIYNRHYYYLFVVIGVVNLINTILSIYFISKWCVQENRCYSLRHLNRLTLTHYPPLARSLRYNGFRTVTVFITNFLVVFGQVYKSASVARECYLEEKAESVSLYVPLAFNVVAKQFRALDSRQKAPVFRMPDSAAGGVPAFVAPGPGLAAPVFVPVMGGMVAPYAPYNPNLPQIAGQMPPPPTTPYDPALWRPSTDTFRAIYGGDVRDRYRRAHSRRVGVGPPSSGV